MIKPLLTTIRGFGAKIKGKRGTYRMRYNDDEYFLLVNPNQQVFSFAKYVTAYKGKLSDKQFNIALEAVKSFHPDVTGCCSEKDDFAYLASRDFSYDDVFRMSKQEFDKILKDFDDAWIIMFGTVCAMTDPSIFP